MGFAATLASEGRPVHGNRRTRRRLQPEVGELEVRARELPDEVVRHVAAAGRYAQPACSPDREGAASSNGSAATWRYPLIAVETVDVEGSLAMSALDSPLANAGALVSVITLRPLQRRKSQ